MNSLKNYLSINPEVEHALSKKLPVLALESTIIAHGMPYPDNLNFAHNAENIVREHGVVPATIAIINGQVHVGIEDNQLKSITDKNNSIEKITTRDIGYAIANKLTGATTVSATMHIAYLARINVFATGGIGGVHRNAESTFDVSQDLLELSRTPMIVVSAGVKAILDIPKTLEQLETLAVPVIGFKTNEFPAFYSRFSGNKLAYKCTRPEDVAAIYKSQQNMKIKSALLVANPIPKSNEIPKNKIDSYIEIALKECQERDIKGKAVTPFLLQRIVELTQGKSLETNIALAINNVELATEIVKAL